MNNKAEWLTFIAVIVGFVVALLVAWVLLFWRKRHPLAPDVAQDWPPGIAKDRTRLLEWAGLVFLVFIITSMVGWLLVYLMTPTRSELVMRYALAIDAIEERLWQAAKHLPEEGTIHRNTCRRPLDPLPIYDGRSNKLDQPQNTEILKVGELVERDLMPAKEYAGLYFYGGTYNLYRTIRWRREADFSSYREAGYKANLNDMERIEKGLELPYVVVYRLIEEPDHRNRSGAAKLEAFVIAVQSGERLCDIVVAAPTVDAVKLEFMHALRQTTGGSFFF
jgi:hypothetical protein